MRCCGVRVAGEHGVTLLPAAVGVDLRGRDDRDLQVGELGAVGEGAEKVGVGLRDRWIARERRGDRDRDRRSVLRRVHPGRAVDRGGARAGGRRGRRDHAVVEHRRSRARRRRAVAAPVGAGPAPARRRRGRRRANAASAARGLRDIPLRKARVPKRKLRRSEESAYARELHPRAPAQQRLDAVHDRVVEPGEERRHAQQRRLAVRGAHELDPVPPGARRGSEHALDQCGAAEARGRAGRGRRSHRGRTAPRGRVAPPAAGPRRRPSRHRTPARRRPRRACGSRR